MINIEGTIEEIIYANEINGYTVCDVRCETDMVTAVGYMPFLNPGESVKLTGKWVNHPDYGDQLKVEYYEKILPQTLEALEKYLASGVIKGIGPATAVKIVEYFGKETFDIISFRPQQLSEVKGISLEKAIRIGQAYAEQNGLRTVMLFLQDYGINPSCCMEIFRIFGENAINTIKEDPYKLSEKISSIGFKSADRIAMKLGMDPASRLRVCSGMKYVLLRAASNGHTWLPVDELSTQTLGLLQIEKANIEDAFATLLFDREIYSEKNTPENRVFLKSFHTAEMDVARSLMALIGYNAGREPGNIEDKLEQLQIKEGIELAVMQKTAVKEALTGGVLVITGGPGTGKTTIIRSIIKLLEQEGCRAELAAPTGRAAKRLSEATGREARTIHRLLEIAYSGDDREMVFQKNENNTLDTDFIIIDEMSMVDIILMNHLLKAVPAGARLILVGDANQLPSVGAGNVLKDIINSGLVKTVKLEEIFRQAQESMIIVNAHRINKGEKPFLNLKDKDFYFVGRKTPESIVDTVKDLCARRLPQKYGYDPMKHIQVLTPTRKGLPGVMNLNNELQKVLNPQHRKKKEKAVRDFIFREGDRVMQIRNNYSLRWEKAGSEKIEGLGVFNGDTGVVTRIDLEDQVIEVLFEDDRLVEYDFGILDELEPAFAVTIHKSQGSEFPVVVLPVFAGPQVLMTRNLLYTAVTRARELVVVVGDEDVLCGMVDNGRESLRFTGLADKLKICGLNSDIYFT